MPLSPLPLPAESFPSGLPRVPFYEWKTSLWRIQDSDCLAYKTYPGPKHRFDAPAGQYAIIYSNSTEHGPFAENYAELDRYIGKENAERYLVKITPREPLLLVDLRSTATRSTLRLEPEPALERTARRSERSEHHASAEGGDARESPARVERADV